MQTLHHFIGIDVSKRHLDVFVEGVGYRQFANTPEGVAELMLWVGEGNHMVGLEATSTYHVVAATLLQQAKWRVNLYNPRQVRDLARGLGLSAKTDRIDAQVIARGLHVVEAPMPRRCEIAMELKGLSRHIQYLTKRRSDLKKKRAVPGLSQYEIDSLERNIDFHNQELKRVEEQWMQLLQCSAPHLERYKLLRSVPRIGHKSARVIVSELPEDLSPYNRKQLAAYFGLVPYDRQSGNSVKRSRIQYGNANLRQPLFSVANLAAFRDPECKKFAETLKAKGKHHLTIVCAIMHKLARRAIAVLLRNSPWSPEMTPTT